MVYSSSCHYLSIYSQFRFVCAITATARGSSRDTVLVIELS